jgi:hypothetical protein
MVTSDSGKKAQRAVCRDEFEIWPCGARDKRVLRRRVTFAQELSGYETDDEVAQSFRLPVSILPGDLSRRLTHVELASDQFGDRMGAVVAEIIHLAIPTLGYGDL